MRGHRERFDLALAHALDSHRAGQQVAAVLGEENAARDAPDLVAGPSDALQAARHRGRRLDLDDEVDGTHVDPELEAARRDDGGKRALLELLLDLAALLAGDRPVVGARDLGIGVVSRTRQRGACLGHDGGGGRGWWGQLASGGASLRLFVESCSQALGEAAGVGEDDGRPMLFDEIDDPGLDVRPQRRWRRRRLAVDIEGGVVTDRGEVFDGYDDGEVELLVAGRLDDGDRLRTTEKGGHGLRGSNGRRQPDALRRGVEKIVETFQ